MLMIITMVTFFIFLVLPIVIFIKIGTGPPETIWLIICAQASVLIVSLMIRYSKVRKQLPFYK